MSASSKASHFEFPSYPLFPNENYFLFGNEKYAASSPRYPLNYPLGGFGTSSCIVHSD